MARKLRRRLPVEVAQQPVAQPVVGQCPQLLLDQLERTAERRTAGHRLRQIERPGIEPHRHQAGEPAHRARQLRVREHLLAAVALQIDQHSAARPATVLPAPVRDRHRQAGQQHLVDAAVERRRHPAQQWPGDRRRQPQGQLPGCPDGVADGIEPAIDQRQRRRAQHPAPERKLRDPLGVLRFRRQPLRPAPQRRSGRRQRGLLPVRDRRPRGRKVGHQDAPRHPVHRQVMDRQQQAAGLCRPGIKPHRLHHHAGRRRKPHLRRLALLGDAGAPRILAEAADIHPPQTAPRRRPSRQPRSPARTRRSMRDQQPAAATHRDDRAPPAGRQ